MDTVKVYVISVKVAVTDMSPVTVTDLVEPVPVPSPDQPEKVELTSGTAERVTTVPAL